MRLRLLAGILLLGTSLLAGPCAPAQSIEDLDLQIHGYATQGFVYSTSNNWDTTNSTDGSSAWTDAVVNLTAQPQGRLRVGLQARYFLLGSYGNKIMLDWAQADYKVNEKFGVRVGKVKTPGGLLNEYQDIDPALLWVLLPQAVYPLASRDSIQAHYGGITYGTFALGERLGRVDYRAFAGQRVISPDDGYFQPYRDQGLTSTEAFSGPTYGGTLRWQTPLEGLLVGGSYDSDRLSGSTTIHSYPASVTVDHLKPYYVFAKYEHKKAMLAGEYSRFAVLGTIRPLGLAPFYEKVDDRSFYAMSSYKLSTKWTGGLYYSSVIDRKATFTPARYQKDWAIAARYDFNPYLYLKFEEHVIDGTMRGYSASNNQGGLKPNSRMTLLKIGVSF